MTITLTKRVRHHHVAYQQQRPTGFLWNPSVSRNLCKLGVSVFLQNGHLWLFNNGSTFNGLFMIMFHYMGEVYVYFRNWNLALRVPFCEHHFVFVVTTRNQKTKKKKNKNKGTSSIICKKKCKLQTLFMLCIRDKITHYYWWKSLFYMFFQIQIDKHQVENIPVSQIVSCEKFLNI